ncbi:MAG: hypothetical protein FWG90_11710 [Oscillospiraceae bacterium]|nr:hypothetical protein [Oscillospiraceae bacterium]
MKNCCKKCEDLGLGFAELVALLSALISFIALILSIIAVIKSRRALSGNLEDFGYHDDYNWSLDEMDDFDDYLSEIEKDEIKELKNNKLS